MPPDEVAVGTSPTVGCGAIWRTSWMKGRFTQTGESGGFWSAAGTAGSADEHNLCDFVVSEQKRIAARQTRSGRGVPRREGSFLDLSERLRRPTPSPPPTSIFRRPDHPSERPAFPHNTQHDPKLIGHDVGVRNPKSVNQHDRIPQGFLFELGDDVGDGLFPLRSVHHLACLLIRQRHAEPTEDNNSTRFSHARIADKAIR